jgi:hypothetical protein
MKRPMKWPMKWPATWIERLLHVLGLHSDTYPCDGTPICRVCGKREGQRRG